MVEPEQREAYDRDGVVLLRQAFDQGWVERLRDATEQAMRQPGPYAEEYAKPGQARFFGEMSAWKRLETFRSFVFDSPAAAIAGEIMGSDRVNFFYDQLLVKEPGASARTPWHQDQPYWAVKGWQVCSIWLALDPVPASSSVQYVAGSHRWGRSYNPQHFSDGSPYADTGLPALPDIEAARASYDIRSFEMSPGDCLVFQAMIVHGAPGNSGTHRRRALSTRWTGDDARYRTGGGEIGFPVEDPGLRAGDRMTCETFPEVWQR